MPSIVDMIAQAEADAERIKREAQQKAKSMIETEESRADEDIEKAHENVRRELILRRENAHHAGERLSEEITELRAKESAAYCTHASQYKGDAVKAIIERLTK